MTVRVDHDHAQLGVPERCIGPGPAGIINFVLALEKGHYLWQFGQFAWTHMILLVVFIPTSFFVSNIFDGLIWFLLPCALVIINDISAYLTGAPGHGP
jgi:phosphatidate cytidylyltransferase